MMMMTMTMTTMTMTTTTTTYVVHFKACVCVIPCLPYLTFTGDWGVIPDPQFSNFVTNSTGSLGHI